MELFNEVAAAFQCQLADLPGRLHETIPNFHHTRWRYDAWMEAVEADPFNRAAGVKTDIEFAVAREGMVDAVLDLLASGELPERVTHNDTKLITFNIGLRFLTDYLQGDTYFKTHREGQNIDRCRKQFKMIQSMEEQMEAMQKIVAGI